MNNMNIPNHVESEDMEDATHGYRRFPLCVYSVSVPENSEIIQVNHWHNEAEIFLIEDGCALFCRQGKDTQYKHPFYKGSIAFVPPRTLHGATSMNNFHCRFIAIVFNTSFVISGHDDKTDEIIRDVIDRFFDTPYMQVGVNPNAEEIAKSIYRIREEYGRKAPGYELRIKSYLLYIFSQYMEAASASPKISSGKEASDIIGRALSFIHYNYGRNINVSDISDTALCSITYLERIFHSTLRTSPMNYLKDLRISKAMQLLGNTDMSISEIAYSVGFNDSSYFSRCFRKNVGREPREYRKMEHRLR